jgi:hypothetical protein
LVGGEPGKGIAGSGNDKPGEKEWLGAEAHGEE